MPYRYFIYLSYKGTHYHGWQIQPGSLTVQEVLNRNLTLILREEIYVVGAGRTDAGVHAPCFYAHFDSNNPNVENEKNKYIYHLNCLLPRDIAIFDIFRVGADDHARFSALSRTYQYRISSSKNPFTTEVAWYYSKNLNLDKMNIAAEILMEYKDFTSFSKLHTDTKTNNCIIYKANWVEDSSEIHFYIKADRFLRNMVRAIVGTMLDIGTGKISTNQFRSIIELKDRSKAGISANALGLHLVNIEYSKDIIVEK